ncbi:hypothetical protein [Mycobacterium aquaticum]|nr:hypothetical protein [Mycobacterium aquaticum]
MSDPNENQPTVSVPDGSGPVTEEERRMWADAATANGGTEDS